MHQDHIRKHQILYRGNTRQLYLVQSCPKGGPISMYSDAGENYAFEPYQLSEFGIRSEPLQFEPLMLGQVLENLRGNKYTVVSVSRSFDYLGKFSSGEATLLDEEGTHKRVDQNSIGQYRIHTPATKEDMRFNVPTTTAATLFSTIHPAEAVVFEDVHLEASDRG